MTAAPLPALDDIADDVIADTLDAPAPPRRRGGQQLALLPAGLRRLDDVAGEPGRLGLVIIEYRFDPFDKSLVLARARLSRAAGGKEDRR